MVITLAFLVLLSQLREEIPTILPYLSCKVDVKLVALSSKFLLSGIMLMNAKES